MTRGPSGPDMKLFTRAPVDVHAGAGLAARHSCSVGRLLAAPAWGLRNNKNSISISHLYLNV